KAGANTVTATLTSASGSRRLQIHEYKGLGALDVTAQNINNTGSAAVNGITSGAAVTTANGDLIFGAVMGDSGNLGTISAGTGYMKREGLADMATEDRLQSSAGSGSASFSGTGQGSYLAVMA